MDHSGRKRRLDEVLDDADDDLELNFRDQKAASGKDELPTTADVPPPPPTSKPAR